MPFTTPDGIVITVECALSAATGDYGIWDASLWNTATWGPDEQWTDISQWVRSIGTRRGFQRDIQTWEAGTASIVLDNRDGRFNPDNPASPYTVAGVTSVRPWRPIRVLAYDGAGHEYLFRGYATAWQETYAGAYPGGGDVAVTVPCVDEFGALARFDGLAQPPVGGGETSGARIHRILDNAGHTGRRDIDVGRNTVQATTLEQDTVAELKLTADSEGGAVYVSANGTVTFDQAYALIDNMRSNTVQSVWGDNAAAGELPYDDLRTAYDGDLVVNIAAFSRVGGTVQTAADNTSRALYLDKRYARTDLICTTDLQVAELANFCVQQFSKPELRVESITVKPRQNPTLLFPQVLRREVRDLVTVRRRMPGGYTVSRDCHIAGISHTLGPDLGWTTTFDLWGADIYQGVGRWDTAVWDRSTFFY